MTTLTVKRDKGWTDKVRKYRVLVDGVEIGRLGEGASLVHELSAGPHVIQARVDWCGSRPLKVEANDNDIVVKVRSSLRGWKILLGAIVILFDRLGYLTLELQE